MIVHYNNKDLLIALCNNYNQMIIQYNYDNILIVQCNDENLLIDHYAETVFHCLCHTIAKSIDCAIREQR